MAVSSAVVAGTNATATAVNNIRTDAVSRRRIYSFIVVGALATGDEQGARYIVENTETVVGIKHYIKSGTSCTFRIQKDTTDIDASIAAGTSVAEETSITSSGLTENQILTLDITGVSGSPDTLTVQVITTYTTE